MLTDMNLTLATAWAPNPNATTQINTAYVWDTAQSTAVALTEDLNGTAISAGGDILKDFDEGEPLYVVIKNVGATTFATSTTVRFDVIQSANANLSSPDILTSTKAIPVAEMTAGATVAMRLNTPVGTSTRKRYVGIQITTTGSGALSATTIGAWVMHGEGGRKPTNYPSACITG